MIKPPKNVLDLPLHVRAEMALNAAAQRAMEEHIRYNLPLHVFRDGKVVEIPVEELRRQLAEADQTAESNSTS